MALLTAQEEKKYLNDFFKETRFLLKKYFEDRSMVFSNSQLYAFIMISPVTIAIACDGNLDLTETTMLVDLAAYFDKNILPSEFDNLPQPANTLSDKDFKKIIYSELRYLCLSMNRYERELIDCIKQLIQLDEKISKDIDPKFSIRRRVIDMMNSVIYNNMGADYVEEAKIRAISQLLKV